MLRLLHSVLRPLPERGHRVEVWLSHPGKSHQPDEIDGMHVLPFQAGVDFISRAGRKEVLAGRRRTPSAVRARRRSAAAR